MKSFLFVQEEDTQGTIESTCTKANVFSDGVHSPVRPWEAHIYTSRCHNKLAPELLTPPWPCPQVFRKGAQSQQEPSQHQYFQGRSRVSGMLLGKASPQTRLNNRKPVPWKQHLGGRCRSWEDPGSERGGSPAPSRLSQAICLPHGRGWGLKAKSCKIFDVTLYWGEKIVNLIKLFVSKNDKFTTYQETLNFLL